MANRRSSTTLSRTLAVVFFAILPIGFTASLVALDIFLWRPLELLIFFLLLEICPLVVSAIFRAKGYRLVPHRRDTLVAALKCLAIIVFSTCLFALSKYVFILIAKADLQLDRLFADLIQWVSVSLFFSLPLGANVRFLRSQLQPFNRRQKQNGNHS